MSDRITRDEVEYVEMLCVQTNTPIPQDLRSYTVKQLFDFMNELRKRTANDNRTNVALDNRLPNAVNINLDGAGE
jgi:hypothetical protein